MNQPSGPSQASLLDYLRLFRLPNVFTAVSEALMGWALADASWRGWPAGMWLILSSACLYVSGMVWNDVFDIEQDRAERPERPLPSGRISIARARWMAAGLMAAGWSFALLAGWLAKDAHSMWLAPATAAALALLILAYDGFAKRVAWGPVVMGGCRVANVLLACSLATAEAAADSPLGVAWTGEMLAIALAIGVYVAGVTWLARREAAESRSRDLAAATAVIAAGLVLLALAPRFASPPRAATFRIGSPWWELFVGLLSVTILRRCWAAVRDPQPERVQQAVKFSILSLIMLHASVTLLAGAQPWMAVVVVALYAPAVMLGRWVYST